MVVMAVKKDYLETHRTICQFLVGINRLELLETEHTSKIQGSLEIVQHFSDLQVLRFGSNLAQL